MGRTLRFLRDQPVGKLEGVGAKIEGRLAMMGITTILDLLEHYPRRYHDRTRVLQLDELRVGEEATVFAEVRKVSARPTRGRRSVVEVVVGDGNTYLYVTFFNQPWRKNQLGVGTEVSLFGKLGFYRGNTQMTNPAVDVIGHADEKTGKIVPIYPQSGKAEVTSWQFQRLMTEALGRAKVFDDPLPEEIRGRLGLVDRTVAYSGIHAPDTDGDRRQAEKRLIFDEFLRMQLGLTARRRAIERGRAGVEHCTDGPLVREFHKRLPFDLTEAQSGAIAEIAADMAAAAPMHRLLQGDVGSGKTVVALTALLMAVQGGHQGALMAPTEVLAEQHHLGVSALVDGFMVPAEGTLTGDRPLRVELLTNRTSAAERRRITGSLASGDVDILIGTHALIYEGVEFHRLGAVVIDEQHRFGVEQRALLRGKGDDPDVLVMTATPIPRTAAMLIYGDLARSELRQLPPGRTPVATHLVGSAPLERQAAYTHLLAEVASGRQGYVVCPLVEGSEHIEAKAVTEEFDRLLSGELSGVRVGLLHGQMPSRDKEAVMTAFRSREIDVLVATTVIEVGVDVSNATVMIIEDAERFGLSQLHQLRGRVGRGADASTCYLFADPKTPDAEARMAAMVDSTDGFLLAERDLDIRGAGAAFGERQSGISDLKLGQIPRDEPVVISAREVAERILDEDPNLEQHPRLAEEVADLLGDDVDFLFKS